MPIHRESAIRGGHMVARARLSSILGLSVAAALFISTGNGTYAQNKATATSPAPTFTKDVLPILQKSCQTCHHPGTNAPMSLVTYQDVRPWARSIKQKVTRREMPPWHI